MKPNLASFCDLEAVYTSFVEALLAGDRGRARELFETWLATGADLRNLYENLVQRALYEIGERWERGLVSVATEHLATLITESLLNLIYPRLFSLPRGDQSAVVACVASEFHQIGGKMVADFFELNGWRGYFMGANTPARNLLNFIQEKRLDVVALSLTVYSGLDVLLGLVGEIRSQFPSVPILVGGQAFRLGGRERAEAIADVRYLPSLASLEVWLKAYPHHAN
jgi:methanogenic corrinoid protein MtbC1